MPIPLLALGIGAVAAPILGGIIGEIAGAGSRAEAERLRREAMAKFNIDLPSVEEIKFQAIEQSKAAQATGSPEARAARMQALRDLQRVSKEGMTPEDQAAMANILAESQAAERGSREAIQSRLPPGSGAAIAAQLSNQQAAAQRANLQGLNVAAEGRRRALSALGQVGGLSGDIEAQQFGEQFQTGQAADVLGRWNKEQAMRAQQMRNENRMARFQAAMERARGQAGTLGAGAQASMDESERQRRLWGGIGQNIGQMAGAAYMGGTYGNGGGLNDEEFARAYPAISKLGNRSRYSLE